MIPPALTALLLTLAAIPLAQADNRQCGYGLFQHDPLKTPSEAFGECPQRGTSNVHDCGHGTTVIVQGSQVLLTAGSRDSTIEVICGSDYKFYHCPTGKWSIFTDCNADITHVFSVDETQH